MKNFKEHVETSFGLYEGVTVPLEQPMIEIDEYTTKSGNKIRDPRKGEYASSVVRFNAANFATFLISILSVINLTF